MNPTIAVLGTARPPFLLLTPACIALGVAVPYAHDGTFALAEAVLALLGGLFAHISVNAFNEFWDFKSGLDLHTERTPFSGGSGVLPAHPELAAQTLILAATAFVLCAGIGVYFLSNTPQITFLGLPGLALIYSYTQYINRSVWACLIAPGLGFGPFMVVGTALVIAGEYSVPAVAASLVPFFQVSNLLLLNQFPDREADARAGRAHLVVRRGRKYAAKVFAAFTVLAYLALAGCVGAGLLPLGALLGLLTLPLALINAQATQRYADDLSKLLPTMAKNVVVTITTPILMSVGMVWIN